MTAKQTIDVLVEGGKASAGPPLGPALGPTGVKVNEVVNAINEKTASYAGMKVPVKVVIDVGTKKFEIVIGSPPTSALIKKEIGILKGTKDSSVVGNITFDQVMKIVQMKKDAFLANDLKGAAKEVLGTCRSLGVTVDGMSAKDVTAAINEGKFDEKFR